MKTYDVTVRLTLKQTDGPRRTASDISDALADQIGQSTLYVEGGREASVYEVDGDVDATAKLSKEPDQD